MPRSSTANPSKRRKKGGKGYDAGKKIKGRKRQLLGDTQGFVLKVQVQPASLSDTPVIGLPARLPRLQLLWTDRSYRDPFANWVQRELGWRVACVRHPANPAGEYATVLQNFLGETSYVERYPIGFRVLPRRWVVERTFAWLSHQRRLSKDYELLPATGEAWIYLASPAFFGSDPLVLLLKKSLSIRFLKHLE